MQRQQVWSLVSVLYFVADYNILSTLDDLPSPSWFDDVDMSPVTQRHSSPVPSPAITPRWTNVASNRDRSRSGSSLLLSPAHQNKTNASGGSISENRVVLPTAENSLNSSFTNQPPPRRSIPDTVLPTGSNTTVSPRFLDLVYSLCDILEVLPMSKLLSCFGDQLTVVTQLLQERYFLTHMCCNANRILDLLSRHILAQQLKNPMHLLKMTV